MRDFSKKFKQGLKPNFFNRDTRVVAQELLGQQIVREISYKNKEIVLRARIVETEAYLGEGDPASHSCKGPTPRSSIMFGPPGFIYVYFIYGNYFMLNFVTEPKGKAGAVLIRAVEPIDGIEVMKSLRPKAKKEIEITSGPARLTMAMQIDKTLNAKPIGWPHLNVIKGEGIDPRNIIHKPRIGISEGQDMLLRYYEQGNPFVSRQ